jgi:tRNA(Ile)-lysidine synthetase-like protein
MTREEIVAFAREHGLNWREDSTNAQTDYKRNKIRNLVFPVFATINPSFVQTLNRDMERFAAELNLILKNGQNQGREGENQGLILKNGQNQGRAVAYAIVEEEWDGTEAVKQPEGVLILDAEKVGAYVEGAWESGDWIKPLGAPGRKKLQDWFTDHHIPADEKPFVPLLKSVAEPHHVLAIIPCCIDHSVRVTATTRRILRISIKNG